MSIDPCLNYYKFIGIDYPAELNISQNYISMNASSVMIQTRIQEIYPIVETNYDIVLGIIIYTETKNYINYGPNYISSDGEYRGSIMTLDQDCYDNFESLKEDIYVAEEAVHFLNIVSPLDERRTVNLVLRILYLLAANKIYPQNMNPKYKEIFAPYIYKLRLKPKHLEKLRTFNQLSNLIIEQILYPMGLKIVPISYSNLKSMNKKDFLFNYELYINNLARQYALNGVCYHLGTIYDYFIVKSKFNLYNNLDIIKKRRNTELELYKSMIQKYKEDSGIDDMRYKNKLRDSIEYMERNLLYTDYHCLIFMRNQGDTLLYHLQNSPELTKDAEVCRGIMLQIFYTLLCLHTKIQCLHCDIHLNNCVITAEEGKVYKNCYIIGEHAFTIETKFNIALIDFGRSLPLPQVLGTNVEQIKLNNIKILNYISKILPDYYLENISKIKYAMNNNGQQFYTIITAIDTLYIVKNYLDFDIQKIDESIRKWLIEVRDFIIKYIRKNIENIYTGTPVSEENINQILIEKYYMPNPNYKKTVPNFVNNYNNTIKITIETFQYSESTALIPPEYYEEKHRAIQKIYKKNMKRFDEEGLNYN